MAHFATRTPANSALGLGLIPFFGQFYDGVLSGKPYVFSTWSDGKGRQHDIVTGTAPSTYTATFSEKMDPASITTSTFKLFKVNVDGSTTQITNVSIGKSTDGLVATLNPFGSSTTTHLARGTKYKRVITTGARDVAGNPLDQIPTTDGLQMKAWTFTVSP